MVVLQTNSGKVGRKRLEAEGYSRQTSPPQFHKICENLYRRNVARAPSLPKNKRGFRSKISTTTLFHFFFYNNDIRPDSTSRFDQFLYSPNHFIQELSSRCEDIDNGRKRRRFCRPRGRYRRSCCPRWRSRQHHPAVSDGRA